MYADEEIEVADGDQVKTLRILDQYKSLYNSNKTLIGWLNIADTIIDYPVMQTEDNEFYLSHNSNLEEDRNGAIIRKIVYQKSGHQFYYIRTQYEVRQNVWFAGPV